MNWTVVFIVKGIIVTTDTPVADAAPGVSQEAAQSIAAQRQPKKLPSKGAAAQHPPAEPSGSTNTATTEKAQQPKGQAPGAQAAARRQRTRKQYSMPFVTNTLTLKSLHAQQAFDRGFQICQEAIYTLSVILRVIAPEEQAIQVEEAVDRELASVAKDIKTELDRLATYAETNGVEFAGVQYSLPREVTPQITSPRSVQYLNLLRSLDTLVERIDTLWLAGIVKDKERSQVIFNWKRRILRLYGTIRNLVFRAMASAQRKDLDNVQDPSAGTLLDPSVATAAGADASSMVTEDSANDGAQQQAVALAA